MFIFCLNNRLALLQGSSYRDSTVISSEMFFETVRAEAHSDPSQTSKMEFFATVVTGWFSDIFWGYRKFVNHPRKYPLKTSKNLWFSDVFRGYRKALNHFCKKLHLRCLNGFWIRFSIANHVSTDPSLWYCWSLPFKIAHVKK